MYIQSSSHDYFNLHSLSDFYELITIKAAGNMMIEEKKMIMVFNLKEFTVFS